REIRYPQPVGCQGFGLPFHRVIGPVLTDREVTLYWRPRLAPQSPSSRIRRSTLQRATLMPSRSADPDLVGPVDMEVLLVDPCDLCLQVLVMDRAFRRWVLLEAVVGVRSDLAAVLS